MEDGMKALDEANAAIDTGKQLSREDADRLKSRMDEAFRFDEDAQLKARAMGDALKSGNLDDIKTLQRDLDALANDPERKKAQQETLDYYRRTTPEVRQRNAEQRGENKSRMEGGMTTLTSAAVQLDREYRARDENISLAKNGNKAAMSIVDTANKRISKLENGIREAAKSIETESINYQSIPTHPHPEIDKRGGRQHEAMEKARENRETIGKTAATTVAGLTLPLAAKGVGLAGRAGLAVIGAIPSAGLAFSSELQASSRRAFDEAGIDRNDRKALERFTKEHANEAREAVGRAFQAGFSDLAGNLTGHLSAERFGELIGFGVGEVVEGVFDPPDQK